MKKKGFIIGIVVVALLLLITGVVLIYTKDNTKTSNASPEKQTVDQELFTKLQEQLKIEGYTLKYVKHEGKIYYFNQVDKDGKVGFEVQYDEETKQITTIDKNTISDGVVEDKPLPEGAVED